LPTAGTAPSSAPAEALRAVGVSYSYGDVPAVRDVTLSVPAGAFVSLLGPSGCGKSTLLKLLCGHLAPSAGRILLGGRDATDLPPERRGLGMVFQSYALFPHLSAWSNVAFGLEVRGTNPVEIRDRVASVFDRVGLGPAERARRPAQLSGGQQQRVALARALAFGPSVLLLDEPFASLDRQVRETLRGELARIHSASHVATLMVTHDQEEALAVSHSLGVMRAGRLVQFGTPQEIYRAPRTPFVARFLGEANLVPGERLGLRAGATILVRPERIVLGGPHRGRIAACRYLGADQVLDVAAGDFAVRIRCRAEHPLEVGDPVTFDIPPSGTWEIPEPDDDA
jgi:ABC-type Fe3+/spermidine/putrescine transport system ATPase subunit